MVECPAGKLARFFMREQNGDMDLARGLYYDGREKLQRNNAEGAIASLEQSLALCDHFKTRELLAQCFELNGNSDRALLEYHRALALNPRSNKTAVRFARLLLELGRTADSREVLVGVLARVSTYGPAKRLLQQCEATNT
jgi:tetratricopeptide (TPR) repeat protein